MNTSKRLLPIVSTLILLVLVALTAPPALHLGKTVHAASRTITLIGNYSGWNYSQPSGSNPTITATQGDTITMKLSSGDGAPHQFLVDLDRDTTNPDSSDCPTTDPCSSMFSSTPTTYTFTVPSTTAAGTYHYICVVHYPAMTGNFIVQAAPTPNFGITSDPTSLALVQASSSTSTITLTSQNGFSGTVSLTAGASPTGLTVSLKPSSVSISPGTPQTATLSINSTAATPSGSYTVMVNGTSGSIINPTTLSVTINAPPSQDFSLSLASTSVNVAQGSTGTTTVTLTSLNGFSGTVTLAGTVSSAGPTVSFSPTSVTVTAGSPGTSTMTVSALGGLYSSVADGNYSVNVTATSGSLSHSKTTQVTVGSSNSSPSASLSIPPTVLVGIVVVVIAAVAAVIFLARRKTAK